MRIRLFGEARREVGFVDAMVALHDGLYEGDPESITSTRIVLNYAALNLNIVLLGRNFAVNESAGTARGIIDTINIFDTESGTLAATFDQMNLSLADVVAASRTVDNANFGDQDTSDESALFNLLWNQGITYRSADFVNEGQPDAFGPNHPELNTKLPWSDDVVYNMTMSGRGEYFEFGNGNDRVFGEGGNDTLKGDNGNDTLSGGFGFDWLHGGNGSDKLYGGFGEDVLNGNFGNDTLDAGHMNDQIYGGFGNDLIIGWHGNDLAEGGVGNDILRMHQGNDIAYGNIGNDRIDGGGGHDTLYGNEGNDTIDGWFGNDRIVDSDGDSDPGRSDDVMTGGPGSDTILSTSGHDRISTGWGADRVEIYYDPEVEGDRFMWVVIEDLWPADTLYIETRHLDELHAGYRAAQNNADADWWTEFLYESGDAAFFASDRLLVRMDGVSATESLFMEITSNGFDIGPWL
ncbi:calcium-binding protein [Pseudooceanicola sp. C21-150M6]|uniref:calcium-binding protein n=1 Tax=Pseudooceanicola sp. C21-150M6 TaxID=3434355 RepID=UPI003D7FF408